MSRHRNFRGRQYSYDEDDLYDDNYGEDYDEDDDSNSYSNKQKELKKQQVVMQYHHNSGNATVTKKQHSSDSSSKGGSGNNSNSLTQYSSNNAKQTSIISNNDVKKTATTTTTLKIGGVLSPPPGWERPLNNNNASAAAFAQLTVEKSTPRKQNPNAHHKIISATIMSIDKKISATKTQTTPTKVSNASLPPATHHTASSTLNETVTSNASSRIKLSMVVVGHVDHGKSTLMGQLLVQSKKVTQRTCDYYKKRAADIGKSSFALAWIMDEDDAERQRGVTMDVAQKTISLNSKYDVYILDAPGHLDFIPQMIVGAALADVALLVYDASSNSNNNNSEAIVKEIRFITRGLGVSQLVVVINKMDLIEWNCQKYHSIIQRLHPLIIGPSSSNKSSFMKQQQQYFQKERVRFVPCSGWIGDNLVVKTKNDAAAWYYNNNNGITLVEAMETFKPPIQQRYTNKPLRLVIIDVYQEGNKISVRGKVIQGCILTHDKVTIFPLGDVTTIFKIIHGDFEEEEEDDEDTNNRKSSAIAGDIVDIVLSDISDISRISPGSVIQHYAATEGGGVIVTSRIAVANLVIIDTISAPILRGTQVSFHMHSADIPATLTNLLEMTTATTTTTIKPRIITGGSCALVEITLSERLCLEEYNTCRALGRFVLRRGGETIAFGRIDSLAKI